MFGSNEEKDTSRRVARSRASSRPRRRATRDSLRKKENDKESSRTTVAKPATPKSDTVETRKAPTTISSQKAKRAKQNRRKLIVATLLVLGFGSSAMVGLTDEGSINVEQVITERNERIRTNQASENDRLVTDMMVPVQNTEVQRQADGGLVGLGTGGSNPELEPTADTSTTTATSTDEVATSTDETATSTDEEATEDEDASE